MPNPTLISLLNYGFRADASKELLTVMLNCPDIDYSTAEELCHCIKLSHFKQEEIENAVRDFNSRKFLHKVQKTYGSVFAANKLYIVNMMFDYEREVNENGQAEKKTAENTAAVCINW